MKNLLSRFWYQVRELDLFIALKPCRASTIFLGITPLIWKLNGHVEWGYFHIYVGPVAFQIDWDWDY